MLLTNKLKIEGIKRSCFSHCATTDGLFNTGVCDREEDGEVEGNGAHASERLNTRAASAHDP